MNNEIQVNSFLPVNIWIAYWKFTTVLAKHIYFSLKKINVMLKTFGYVCVKCKNVI